jgi:hypothetical protein
MLRKLAAAVALVAFVAVALVPTKPALATDLQVPGKILIVKPQRLQKYILKPTSPAVFPLPPAPNAPTIIIWQSWIKWFDNWFHFLLIPSNWKGLGNPPGSKGYKYKGTGTLSDPCKVVLVKPKIVKAICKGPTVTPDPPHPGVVAVQLGADDLSWRYCAEFGGTDTKNDSSLLKRKDAPAPGLCASPSGAFVAATRFLLLLTSFSAAGRRTAPPRVNPFRGACR